MSGGLPESWIEIQLEDIIQSMESGGRPKGGVKGIIEGIPSIGGEHLNNTGGFNFSNMRYVPERFYKSMLKGHIAENDILIVKDGATTGKASFVCCDFPFDKAVVNEHVFVVRIAPPLNKKFVFYFLWSHEGNRRILENFQGSAQGGINRQFASRTLIPMPPLEEQKRIVAKLDAIMPRIDSVKERLEKIPAILKRFRQSVLTAAVTGKLTEKWREEHLEVESADVLLVRIRENREERYVNECDEARRKGERNPRHFLPVKKSGFSEVSCSWVDVEIQQICNVETGATPLKSNVSYYDNGKVPWIKSGDIQNGDIWECKGRISEKALKETNVKYYPVDTLLIAMYGEGKTRGQIGRLKFPATSNQACAALVNPSLDEATRMYIFLYGLSQYERSYCQIWCMGHQAAFLSDWSDTRIPSLKITPVMTSPRSS